MIDIALIQLIVSIASACGTLVFIVYMVRQQNALIRGFSPIIKNVMSNLGQLGSDKNQVKDVEKALMDDIGANIGQMFPELDIMSSLGIISPDTIEKLTANPWTLPILVQRYGPLVKEIMGRREGSPTKTYDV